ncbi:phosphoribosyltransferase family protein [Nodularia sp. UHCC 0506]|uniref:phosphoribosyltransferase family protein n=1 Tax=Nodularia sp. UHCC 0506 TaxID=3110243 RepID=UPI002B2063D8|nr:phosphoribosyltransferase family protein [Nodularia sp. UHCC 0506]MEA5514759.1 phosphoribosyltransferase family protein [Nodularia sp. UHCC 0506]
MRFFDSLPDLFYLGFYCPTDSGYFNEYSNTILELKDQKEDSIIFFLKEIRKFLSDEDISIATVPSGKSSNRSSGIRELAKQLVKSYSKFTDAVFCLERFKDSNDDRTRTIEKHLKTIKVANSSVIKNKKVILMDDVLTTGTSIQACKKLLLEAGAKEIKVIVLGKTIRNVEDAHNCIDQEDEDEFLKETIDQYASDYYWICKSYEMEKDSLKEEINTAHILVDEWANDQHGYVDPDDDEEHNYIKEKSQEKHEIIDKIYNEKLSEIYENQEKEDLCYEHDIIMASEWYQYYQYMVNEANLVLEGDSCTCFSVDNPFVSYFQDWYATRDRYLKSLQNFCGCQF